MDETPATREPAPGPLALVQDFVNSTKLPGGWDELADVDLTVAWLQAHGFDFIPEEAQRRRIVDTRESLRVFLGVNSGQPVPDGTAARLTKLLDSAGIHPVVGEDGVRLGSKARGYEGFMAAILSALVESSIDGTFRRLKVCRAETCQWTFYDNSKNGCGTWCSMRSCGSRAKARAYRERRRAEDPTGEDPAATDQGAGVDVERTAPVPA